MPWSDDFTRQTARYRDGLERLPEGLDARQRQLTRVANAALGAGFAQLMAGRPDEAEGWLREAAARYRESYEGAPAESWGRMIGAVKLRVIIEDSDGAQNDARWTLESGAASAASPIGRYAAAVAYLVVGQDAAASDLAEGLLEDNGSFPSDVAEALVAVATRDSVRYQPAVESVVESFETREEYLEDVPIADTALMLARLARSRGIETTLDSPLLPPLAA